MSALVVILGLLFLVLIHELGHFLVAKAVGARATKFYVGFPPAALKRQHGDTEYGIGAIPLGGYVRIVGMTRPQPIDLYRVADAADEAAGRRPAEQPDTFGVAVRDLRRALADGDLDAAGPLAAEARDALEADHAADVERGAGTAPEPLLNPRSYAQARKDLVKLAEDVDPRAYWRLAVWRRVAIIAAGPLVNVLAAIVILTGYFISGVPKVDVSTRVHAVSLQSAAAASGMRPGDVVIAVDGRPTGRGEQVSTGIQAGRGAPVTLRVRRAGRQLDLRPERPQRLDQRWILGFQLAEVRTGTKTYGPVAATTMSLRTVGSVTRQTLGALVNVVHASGRKNLHSTVGIVTEGQSTVKEGTFPGLLALVSLALAIFNLLPFLPLDGGHIVFAVAERLRGGRPVPRAVFERVSAIGIVLMLMLFVVGLSNDLGHLSQP